MLRKEKVVGKFVEFFGEGTASLSVPDRATIGNMAPEYGATMGFFPVDDGDRRLPARHRPHGRARSTRSSRTSRRRACSACRAPGEIDYTKSLTLDLRRSSRRSPDRSARRTASSCGSLKSHVHRALQQAGRRERLRAAAGQARASATRRADGRRGTGAISDAHACRSPTPGTPRDVVEMVEQPADARSRAPASPTPCRHRQRRRADRRDHVVHEHVESRRAARRGPAREEGGREGPHGQAAHQDVARARLARRHRLPDQDRACCRTSSSSASASPRTAARRASATPATCRPRSTRRSRSNDLVCAAVLSGNRNFEARIHPNLKANFLASPPLVVAYAIAGTVLKDLTTEPLGKGKDGPVYLRDIWPTSHEIAARDELRAAIPRSFRRLYGDLANANPLWRTIAGATGQVYNWPRVDLHREAAVLRRLQHDDRRDRRHPRRARARHLRRFGHHRPHLARPARSSRRRRPACTCMENDVSVGDFNSYGSRRGNHEVMMRGTFANVRIKNLMLPAKADGSRDEGGVTLFQPARREDADLRRGDEVHRARHADRRVRRRGIRHRQLARLGGEGHAAPRRQGRHREELRAHPPLEPGRHGRAAAAVQGPATASTRSASRATRRSTSPASTRHQAAAWT